MFPSLGETLSEMLNLRLELLGVPSHKSLDEALDWLCENGEAPLASLVVAALSGRASAVAIYGHDPGLKPERCRVERVNDDLILLEFHAGSKKYRMYLRSLGDYVVAYPAPAGEATGGDIFVMP